MTPRTAGIVSRDERLRYYEWLMERRARLSPGDTATVDQVEAGVRELMELTGVSASDRDMKLAIRGGLIALHVLEARAQALEESGLGATLSPSEVVEHCTRELALAYAGLVPVDYEPIAN